MTRDCYPACNFVVTEVNLQHFQELSYSLNPSSFSLYRPMWILQPWVKKVGQLVWVMLDPTKCHEGLSFSWNTFVAQFIEWLHKNQLKSMAAGGQKRAPGTALFGGTDPLWNGATLLLRYGCLSWDLSLPAEPVVFTLCWEVLVAWSYKMLPYCPLLPAHTQALFY